MIRAWVLGLAASLLLIGCGGSGSSAPATAPAPVQLKAAYDPAATRITLTWNPAAGTFDGYDIQVRVNGGAFAKINPTPIGNQVTSAFLTFTSAPPELATFDFRVAIVWNGVAGSYSNIAEIRPPLNPPTYVYASYSVPMGGVSVTWGTPSLVADHYVLERAACDATGTPTGPWNALPLPTPLASSFLDTAVSETEHYRYRATAWAGSLSSTTTDPGQVIAIPPPAPTAFTAQALPGAVVLSWVNQSQTATQIQITRGSASGYEGTSVVATLPASATSFQDAGLPLGFYTYGINISNGTNTTTGPTLLAAPGNPPGAPLLTQTVLTVSPAAFAYALSPRGLWANAISGTPMVPSLSWGTWPDWSPTSGSSSAQSDCLRLDAQSLPHVLYTIPAATGNIVTHAWFDGTAWTTEALAQATSGGSLWSAGFCLDATGSPQTILTSDAGRFYTRKVTGSWVQEAIVPASTVNGTPHLFLDPAGAPHVLIATTTDTREFSRAADGTWATQTLPNPLSPGAYYAFEDGVWADGATAWVFYKVPDAANYLYDDFWVMQKAGGTWQAPILLRSFYGTGISSGASVALSPDGTRVAAVCCTRDAFLLFTPSGQGWIESILPIPPGDTPSAKAAFDGANRLHILVRPSAATGDLVDLHE